MGKFHKTPQLVNAILVDAGILLCDNAEAIAAAAVAAIEKLRANLRSYLVSWRPYTLPDEGSEDIARIKKELIANPDHFKLYPTILQMEEGVKETSSIMDSIDKAGEWAAKREDVFSTAATASEQVLVAAICTACYCTRFQNSAPATRKKSMIHTRAHTNNKNLRLPGPISKVLLSRLEEAISAVQEEEEREKKDKKAGAKAKAKGAPRPASATATR